MSRTPQEVEKEIQETEDKLNSLRYDLRQLRHQDLVGRSFKAEGIKYTVLKVATNGNLVVQITSKSEFMPFDFKRMIDLLGEEDV